MRKVVDFSRQTFFGDSSDGLSCVCSRREGESDVPAKVYAGLDGFYPQWFFAKSVYADVQLSINKRDYKAGQRWVQMVRAGLAWLGFPSAESVSAWWTNSDIRAFREWCIAARLVPSDYPNLYQLNLMEAALIAALPDHPGQGPGFENASAWDGFWFDGNRVFSTMIEWQFGATGRPVRANWTANDTAWAHYFWSRDVRKALARLYFSSGISPTSNARWSAADRAAIKRWHTASRMLPFDYPTEESVLMMERQLRRLPIVRI